MNEASISQILGFQSMANGGSIQKLIGSFIALNAIRIGMPYLQQLGTTLSEKVKECFKHRFNQAIENIQADHTAAQPFTSKIQYFRNYNLNDPTQISMDALLSYFASLDNVVYLEFRKLFIVRNKDAFPINDNVHAKIERIDYELGDASENVATIVFRIFSYTWTLTQLRAWVDTITTAYEQELKNGLGTQRYYFDQVISSDNVMTPNRPIVFKMTPFHTNKSLKNLFGHDIDLVRERVDHFIHHPEWYERHGIPMNLGIMLSGKPGTGKTSLIKSIAKDTNRHILNIRLNAITSIDTLKHLFYSEELLIQSANGGPASSLKIPQASRVLVLEEADQGNDLLLRREAATKPEELSETDRQMIHQVGYDRWLIKKRTDDCNKLDLAVLLSLIDGILETPGRIMIMTTNRPQLLDPALLRPGRMDINIEFKCCDAYQLTGMLTHFYDVAPNEKQKEEIERLVAAKSISPALAQEAFLRCPKSIEDAIGFLRKEGKEESSIDDSVLYTHDNVDVASYSAPPLINYGRHIITPLNLDSSTPTTLDAATMIDYRNAYDEQLDQANMNDADARSHRVIPPRAHTTAQFILDERSAQSAQVGSTLAATESTVNSPGLSLNGNINILGMSPQSSSTSQPLRGRRGARGGGYSTLSVRI